jgi:hypothetical protein
MSDKKGKKPVEHKKSELSFTYDDCTIIWKFDNQKTTTGPYEVEVKYKKSSK